MKGMTMYVTNIMNEAWITLSSHPASWTFYQEATVDGENVARITLRGDEVVSPSADTEQVYQEYNSRVARWIEEDAALGARETAADRAAWYDQDR